MAAQYGVNYNISNGAASPIKVQSDTPIGIAACIKGANKEMLYTKAGYESTDEMPIFAFSNVSKAIDFTKDLIKENNLQDFRLLDSLTCIDNQDVACVIIISFFEESDEEATNLTNCLNAIEAFKKAKHRTGFTPDIIIAPYYSSEAGIKAKLESIASAMNITAIVDLYANNTGEAISTMEAFSSKRLVAAWPQVQILNSQGKYAYVPQSPIIAGLIAHTDGDTEYGFSDSYSNRVMNGVTGVEHFIDFVMGEDCDADRLRKNHISTCILCEGYRSWGGETSDEDTIWQDLARVRTFDRIAIAAQKASFKAIDKKASELYFIKISVEELLRDLKGAKVLIGYEVSWDEERNTNANISAGKFYLNIKMMNNPIVKQITLELIYSDEWADDLVKSISES
ncbi:phage tail sheath family protein [Campylobacter jejuni]|uniref:phage tail sheath family protein n=1 Tax=unclassified Campylobacter TaxID=2593542 RepID=UPI000873990B|nr:MULTISPECIES: phage tail protein [unclassified Campylobacter]EAH9333996.1 phage tail sheath family protein [Campylobacter jejuni]EAH9335684.1 phage tail sheath family protein [Campylobacter jejuni]EAJ4373671.1 phage tail sheath family protein [Campylobacter jejuni]EAJ5638806.1 phage tail sheath family protein [Campylobacter jejuni]EAK1698948.1 phage tail sheath family protein [Campylobacter jejuni]